MGIGGVAPGPGADDAAAADQASLGYDDDKDMFWRWSAKLPQSGVLAAEALRDLHAGDIDGTIRYILKEKRGATMEEVFQTGIIKDVLVNIEQQRQAEAQPEPVVEAAHWIPSRWARRRPPRSLRRPLVSRPWQRRLQAWSRTCKS